MPSSGKLKLPSSLNLAIRSPPHAKICMASPDGWGNKEEEVLTIFGVFFVTLSYVPLRHCIVYDVDKYIVIYLEIET